jgi:putative spermidine/putrescine transport system permease protein
MIQSTARADEKTAVRRATEEAIISQRRSGPPPKVGFPWGKLLHYVFCSLSYIFLLSPMIVVIGASLHGGEYYTAIKFPPEDPSFRWYAAIPGDQLEALGLSFLLAGAAALGACLIGIPAALGIVRGKLPGKTFISTVFRAPLQIPAIVTGIAFLQLFYLVGDATGLYIQGTFWGLYLGHVFVATPYVVGTVTAILQRFDTRLEEAAFSLGASRWSTFWRVTLPVIKPGVYAGVLYAFMVSFGDVPISIFLTAPGYVTYPIELFYALENDFDPSILASASLVIFFCLLALLSMQKLVGLDTLLRSGSR